jgi:integrase
MTRSTASEADALVFTAPQGGVLRAAGWRQRVWKAAVSAAGLEPLRIHDLRHTAVSLWIAAGDNPKEVSRRAGHTSVAFTLDRYGHLYPDADVQSRARLDALIAEDQAPSGGRLVHLPH